MDEFDPDPEITWRACVSRPPKASAPRNTQPKAPEAERAVSLRRLPGDTRHRDQCGGCEDCAQEELAWSDELAQQGIIGPWETGSERNK